MACHVIFTHYPESALLCASEWMVEKARRAVCTAGVCAPFHGDARCIEGSTCGCSYMGFAMGGCSRCKPTYWRIGFALLGDHSADSRVAHSLADKLRMAKQFGALQSAPAQLA